MAIDDYSQIYEDAGKQYGVDPALLMAMGEQESSGNPNALGEPTKYGQASGIAQLIPATAKALGVTDPTDPKQAIPAQAKLLRENLDRYHDPEKALMAYHGGTDQNNWGDKTKAYPASVYKHYKQRTVMEPASSQQIIEEDIDPFEYARAKLAKQNGQVSSGDDDIDPVEYARKKIAEKAAEDKKTTDAKKIGVGEDLALTAISAPIKAVGALPQIPAMAGNAIANAVGYGVGKLSGASEEQQKKLNNLNPFFTGNTPADALLQAGNAVIGNDPGEQNPLTGPVLHDPQHYPAKYLNAGIQAAVGGPATGLKMLPSVTGGLGAEAASEVFPNNPLAPIIGGLAGGTIPTAAQSIKFRASPEELAHKTINELSDNPGAPPPQGNFSFPNEREIIPGSKPTLAQATNDPNLALVERQLQSKNPAAFKSLEQANEQAREQHFQNAAGTAQDIEAMKTAREAQRQSDTSNIFKPGQISDSTPVVTKIDEILNGPGGERSSVKNTLTKIRGMIAKDSNGQTVLENNPEKLYKSVKHEIEDMMDKKNLNNAEGRQASSELNQVKKVLDDVIDKGTPGYKKYLDNYSKASGKIDAAQWLQDLKLTDAAGNYTLAKVKNALQNAKKLQGSRGLNEAKHITPDQMKALESLHDDLLRREDVARASMPRGSNTAQNLLMNADTKSAVGKVNKLAGGNIPGYAGSMVGAGVGSMFGFPGTGALAGDIATNALQSVGKKRMAAAETAMQNFMLDPQSYKQYLLNHPQSTFGGRFKNNLLEKP